MEKGSCMVGQSGGPTAVINASLLGIIEENLKAKAFDHVYGLLNGIDGIIKERFIDFNDYSKEELTLLKTTPAAALGSVRFKMPSDLNDEIYKNIEEIFHKYNIKCFYYIGGNDSMDTCHKLGEYFKNSKYKCQVIGIPKTIDNDMVLIDHTPGYGSAVKFIYTAITEIYQDTNVYQKGRVTFVEIMGRDSGWLTCASKIASYAGYGPDLIYIPEHTFCLNEFLEDVKNIYNKKQKVLVAVSEGIRDEDGNYLLQKRLYNQNDNFGHLQLGGVGVVLAEMVNKELGLPVRSVELNILQRSAAHILSKTDITEAYNAGKYGIKIYLKGYTDKMVTISRTSNSPYRVKYTITPLASIANYVKPVPNNWINERGNNITDDYLEYALPLIQGDIKPHIKNGIIKYFKIKTEE